jgi:hypothetical protein
MRRGFLGLAVCLLIAPAAPARAQDFGLIGGLNISEINVSGDESLNVALTHKTGPVGGLFVTFADNDVFWVELEALLAIKGTRTRLGGLSGDIRLTTVDLPVLFRYAPPRGSPVRLHLFAGPYASYLLRASTAIEGGSRANVKDAFDTFDFGAVVGMGMGAGPFRFDFRYAVGLTDILNRSELGTGIPLPAGSDLEYRNRGFSLLAGYRF